MGRVLKYLSDRMELAVVSLAGGLKDNAIPRECEAEIVIPEEQKSRTFRLYYRTGKDF